METEESSPQSRRTFLMVMAAAAGAIVSAASILPIVGYLFPRSDQNLDSKVELDRIVIASGKPHFFSYKGTPAIVLEPEQGSIIAFSAVCTHLGCIVQWDDTKDNFLCPCHGGRFSVNGSVLSGPPPSPLEPLPVTIAGDQIFIG